MRMRWAATLMSLGLGMVGAAALAQETLTAPAYDVSTVKPSKADATTAGSMFNGGKYEGTNITVRGLLGSAFGKREALIVGMPQWAKQLHFDVQGKSLDTDESSLKKQNMKDRQLMLRKLLEDRFQLKWHMEQREIPVYAMVVAKGGIKMKAPAETQRGSGISMRKRGEMNGRNCPMEVLASVLSDGLDRPVVDQTGLTERYDFTLTFTPDNAPVSADAEAMPSIFTAVQEQLGLKLQPGKAMQEILVIDSVSQPNAD